MSYVPPHKRASKTQGESPPTPAQMIPQFKKSLNLNSSRRDSDHKTNKSNSYGKKIVYADNSISRWMAISSMDDHLKQSSLVPVSLESMEHKPGDKPLTLVVGQDGHSLEEHQDIKSSKLKQTWASVAESVHTDLLSVFENVRNELVDQTPIEIKPTIVARLGKVLFRRKPSANQDLTKDKSVTESYIKHFNRTFYTNVPVEYMEHVKSAIVPELGVQFEAEKELYHVKLADTKRPESTLSCKCRIQKDENKLELYKIELNQLRHLIVDASCLESNVDFRFALCSKRTLTALQDEEMQSIRDLIGSAIFDSNVKGGLRWPLGKANAGGQYRVVGVWHTNAEAYCSSLLRLRVRKADRYDFLTSTGEVTREIDLKLIGMTRSLMDEGNEAEGVLDILEDALLLIRNHFLVWGETLVSRSES